MPTSDAGGACQLQHHDVSREDAAPAPLPALVQLRVRPLHEQLAQLADQAKRLAAELNPVLIPVLIPTPDVQRLLWIPGVGRVVTSTPKPAAAATRTRTRYLGVGMDDAVQVGRHRNLD